MAVGESKECRKGVMGGQDEEGGEGIGEMGRRRGRERGRTALSNDSMVQLVTV